MLFFLLVPVWLLCVVCGVALLFVRQYRRIGMYAITVPTAALLFSFAVSTAVLYVGAKLAPTPSPSWYGIAIVAAYVIAIGVGGIAGAIAGFFGTRKLLPSA